MFCGDDDFGCGDNLNNLGIIFETESCVGVDNSSTKSGADSSSTDGEIIGTIIGANVLTGTRKTVLPLETQILDLISRKG